MARKSIETSNKSSSTKTYAKPVGSISLKVGEIVLFTKEIWQESTAKDKLNNDINELVISDEEKAKDAIIKLIQSGKLTVHVNKVREADTETSLADLIG